MSYFRNSPSKDSSPNKSERQSHVHKMLTGRFGGQNDSTDQADSPSLLRLARPGFELPEEWRINTFNVPLAAADTLQAIPSELPLFITPSTSEEVKNHKLSLKSQKSDLVYKKAKDSLKSKKPPQGDKSAQLSKKETKMTVQLVDFKKLVQDKKNCELKSIDSSMLSLLP
jgi:hypothetical protein